MPCCPVASPRLEDTPNLSKTLFLLIFRAFDILYLWFGFQIFKTGFLWVALGVLERNSSVDHASPKLQRAGIGVCVSHTRFLWF